ncbi:MAG TPA: hypothetical protein VEF06_05265 [Bryobacteraceae bacterium]|nr:hypothetical protein [Bryobacteraceae bacterium]
MPGVPQVTRQVPVYAAGELSVLPDHPVVIRGFRPELDCRSIEDLLLAAGSPTISGSRDGDICEYFELPSDQVARQFRAGTLGFNVVDSYVESGALTIPPVIGAKNLLLCSEATRHYEKSLIITRRGTFTRTHSDAGGLGGWMFLFAGRKIWHLWDRVWFPLLYDVVNETCFDEFAHPHPDAEYRRILEELPRWEASIGAGELLWFPEAWPHRVWTTEDAYGYGGSTLDEERLGHAVEAILRDQRLGFPDSLHIVSFLNELMATDQLPAEPYLQRIEEVRRAWEKNR